MYTSHRLCPSRITEHQQLVYNRLVFTQVRGYARGENTWFDMPLSGDAVPFNIVQQHVANIIKGNVLVGHSLWNDLSGRLF
jgi:hypothetical protein